MAESAFARSSIGLSESRVEELVTAARATRRRSVWTRTLSERVRSSRGVVISAAFCCCSVEAAQRAAAVVRTASTIFVSQLRERGDLYLPDQALSSSGRA